METIFDQMLQRYDLSTPTAKRNATYEVMQQVALAGLERGGFFKHAAFYGGTCLRIFHDLQRFSEDMDFTLLQPMSDFKLEDYFQPIVDEFKASGRDVTISKKNKSELSKVESAFLKEDTGVYNIAFQTEKSIKVKIEVDVCPPTNFGTEMNLLLWPRSFMTRCVGLSDLFAGKMHALIFRKWGSRVKGRDWYDFEWYVRHGVPLNFKHFCERAHDFNGLTPTLDEFYALLKERLASTDMAMVKRDVLPFVKSAADLEIWSNDYFLRLVGMMRVEE